MKAIERNLYSRNGYYYFRKSIPRSLHPILPHKEIWIGLNTKDLSIARLQSVQIDYEVTRQTKTLQERSKDSPLSFPNKALHDYLTAIHTIKTSYGYEPQPKQNFTIQGKDKGGLPFSKVVAEYLKDCPTDTHGTRFHKENTYKLFIELMGDIDFRFIDKDKAKSFKTKLMKIPSNAKKLNKIESFVGVDLEKLKGKPQHPKTINNRLAYLTALFNWAIRQEYYHGSNPFSNLSIRGQKVTANRRHPFKTEELQALFRNGLGKEIIGNSLYCVPFIGLYSGMRLNEICQLYVNDVRQENGIWLFDVNDDGDDKSLKTITSRRIIPIHDELIRLSFLDYVDRMRAQKHQRVFPDIPMGKATQNYSSIFTKRFWRLLKQLNIKRDGLCFHSLRHNFIDGLRNAGVERSIVMALTGHQSGKDVHDAYGYGYNLDVLKENINKLEYASIKHYDGRRI